MKAFRDLTGTQINKFTVIHRVEKPIDSKIKRKEAWWKCICQCGNEFIGSSNSILHCGKTSCGCVALYKKDKHHAWKGFEEISSTVWTRIIWKANFRKISFNITMEYVWDIFLKQNKICALSGIELFFSKARDCSGNASLDRIDSKVGYEIGNVQWIDKRFQAMKMDMPEDEFIDLCKRITFHKRK